MLSFYTKYKEEREYKKHQESLATMYNDLEKLTEKISDIRFSKLNLSDQDKLVGILEAQIVVVENDIKTLGYTMTRFFDDELVTREIPLGADITETKNISDADKAFMDHLPIAENDNGYPVSMNATWIETRMDIVRKMDEIGTEKLVTINKLKIKKAIKSKMISIQKAYAEKRKNELIVFINNIDIVDGEELEYDFILTLFNEFYTDITAVAISKNAKKFLAELKSISHPRYKVPVYDDANLCNHIVQPWQTNTNTFTHLNDRVRNEILRNGHHYLVQD